VIFMLLASLPFVRYIQLLAGSARPLWRDSQVRWFFILTIVVVAVLTLWQFVQFDRAAEPAFREALFNAVSIVSGTGYSSTDYQLWGGFAVAVFFLIGLVGGCAGSTCCSVKIFRYQLLFSAIRLQVQRIHSPRGVFTLRYDGRTVEDDVINSVMAFFVLFFLSLAAVAITLALFGLQPITAISGAVAALANIGPGLGPEIGPSGNYAGLPDQAKWLLAMTMLVGRLELMSVFVLFTFAFWRR
ncbi:MAG: potassium transporter TrkG, partial [Pseudomonadota bacterium]